VAEFEIAQPKQFDLLLFSRPDRLSREGVHMTLTYLNRPSNREECPAMRARVNAPLDLQSLRREVFVQVFL
jgi:hypothetical protein